ncbi:cupin domain-containing protein [Streptomyces sp. NPDC057474]|uniref:cupin domain-containing protein n=1 Tax=Streptomyces sp. NPDC057474 TaxID=3346144 RepID=UPI0036833D9A
MRPSTTVEGDFLNDSLDPPGARQRGSPPHRHPGPAFGYVIKGETTFELEGEPQRVIKVGETFWEPGDDVIRLPGRQQPPGRRDGIHGHAARHPRAAGTRAGERGRTRARQDRRAPRAAVLTFSRLAVRRPAACRLALRRLATCRLPPAACRLALRRLPSAVCRLPSAVCRLPSAVCRLPSAVCRLPRRIPLPRNTHPPCNIDSLPL